MLFTYLAYNVVLEGSVMIVDTDGGRWGMLQELSVDEQFNTSDTIHLATIIVGEKFYGFGMTFIKSAILTTQNRINIYVVTSDSSADKIMEARESWPDHIKERVNVFRIDIDDHNWNDSLPLKKGHLARKLSALGALFKSDFLRAATSKIIYMDADFVLIDDLAKLWATFHRMGPKEAIASTTGARYLGRGYMEFNDTYLYNNLGINAGLMLFDMGKLRTNGFQAKYIGCSKLEHRTLKNNNDQDLFVQYFQNYPDEHYVLPCSWNVRNSMSKCDEDVRDILRCEPAEQTGIHTLHGTRTKFLTEGQYGNIFNCMVKINFQNEAKSFDCLSKAVSVFKKSEKDCKNKENFLNPLEDLILRFRS